MTPAPEHEDPSGPPEASATAVAEVDARPTLELASKYYLAVVALVWVVLGGVSVLAREDPHFRPFERVALRETWTLRPNASVSMDAAVGDLAHLSGVKALEVPRAQRFTTDELGFRNPKRPRMPRVVVVGDSFVLGVGLDDADTLAARLGEALGEPVYNYGLETGFAPLLMLRDRRLKEQPPALVIYAPASRYMLPLPSRAPASPPQPTAYAAPGLALSRRLEAWQRDNGLTQIARRTQQGLRYRAELRDDLIYPEGQPALALSLDRQGLCVSPRARWVSDVAKAHDALKRVWAKRGTRFVVAPIPESGTVYPELFPASQRARAVSPSFLDELFARLAQSPVDAVDLRPVFAEHKSPYLYLRDDTHWTPRAVRLAASAIAAHPAVRGALGPR